MVIHKSYQFVATTADCDGSDEIGTLYIADAKGGPYLTLMREFESELPQPEDLYIEYGDQGTELYGSLKKLTLTRSKLDALIEGGTAIQIELQITDEEWSALEAGLNQLLKGLESFVLHH